MRDRVAQAAAKLVLEPIFEAQFLGCSFGYRPGRGAKEATMETRKWLNFGLEFVVDADIRACFDEIPHDRLIEAVASRVSDGCVLRLIRMWLKSGVMVGGTVEATGQGTPQGGVISPLLCNVYLHQLDAEWERRGLTRRYGANAQLVRYADDILVLSSKPVGGVLEELRSILAGMGLSLSEKKTRIVKAEEGFDFLGFRFERKFSRKHGKRVTYFRPNPKSVKRVREKVRDRCARPHEVPEGVVEALNRLLLGWREYFRHSNAHRVFVKVEDYALNRFRRFLRRRKNDRGLGKYRDLPDGLLFEKFGLARLAARGAVRYALRDAG